MPRSDPHQVHDGGKLPCQILQSPGHRIRVGGSGHSFLHRRQKLSEIAIYLGSLLKREFCAVNAMSDFEGIMEEEGREQSKQDKRLHQITQDGKWEHQRILCDLVSGATPTKEDEG